MLEDVKLLQRIWPLIPVKDKIDTIIHTRGSFRQRKIETFYRELKEPENGIRGFYRQVPHDILKNVLSPKFSRILKEYGFRYAFLTPLHEDISIGVILLIDPKKNQLPITHGYVEVFGREEKGLKFSIPLHSIINVDKIEERNPIYEEENPPIFPEEILTLNEIDKLFDEIIDAPNDTRALIKGQLFGATGTFTHPPGTFSALYYSGRPEESIFEKDRDQIFRVQDFIAEMHFPFSLETNRKPLRLKSYLGRYSTCRMPLTQYVFFTQKHEEIVNILRNRHKILFPLDGALIGSDPFSKDGSLIESALNTKTEIPLVVDYCDINYDGYEGFLSEIQASLAFHKYDLVRNKIKETRLVQTFDENILDFVALETDEKNFVKAISLPDKILDQNINFGRYENSIRFFTAIGKIKGKLDGNQLDNSTKIIGGAIARLISSIPYQVREKCVEAYEQELRLGVHSSEQPFLKLFKDVYRSYGIDTTLDILIKNHSKASNQSFENSKIDVLMEVERNKKLGRIREISNSRFIPTKWFKDMW